MGQEAIILWTTRNKLDNVIATRYLVLEVSQVVAEGWIRLIRQTAEHHAVSVKVHHMLLQQIQGFLDAKTGPAGRETPHKDGQVWGEEIVFHFVSVVDLDLFSVSMLT